MGATINLGIQYYKSTCVDTGVTDVSIDIFFV